MSIVKRIAVSSKSESPRVISLGEKLKEAREKIVIEVDSDSYSIYNDCRLIANEDSKNDPDWAERLEAAIQIITFAGGVVKDFRT